MSRSHTDKSSSVSPREGKYRGPYNSEIVQEPAGGLTKRELVAAMALQGWLAGCQNAYSEFTGEAKYADTAARACVKFADALLEELAK